MDKDNRSVNERLDAIEDKLTYKPKKTIFFNDILVKETGLTANDYFQGGIATYKVSYSKTAYIFPIAMIVILSLYLIATLCLNAFVEKQSTNALTILLIIVPLIHASAMLLYALFSSKSKPLSKSKHCLIAFEITEDNLCKVTVKKDIIPIIINSTFFLGELTLFIMCFFIEITVPSHLLYIFVSTLVGIMFLAFVELSFLNGLYRGELSMTYEKEDSKAVFSNGWHFLKK